MQSELIESVNAIKTSRLNQLSKQQIIDCTNNQIYMNLGCNGGHISNSLQFVIDNGGLVNEIDYPYTNSQGQCKEIKRDLNKTGITQYTEIGYLDVNKMMDSIIKYGPLIAYVAASSPYFQFYASGVLDDSSCLSFGIDHVVLIVGFGRDGLTDKDYWLVKNSWSSEWGEVKKAFFLYYIFVCFLVECFLKCSQNLESIRLRIYFNLCKSSNFLSNRMVTCDCHVEKTHAALKQIPIIQSSIRFRLAHDAH